MSTEIFLFRHGEIDNPNKVFYGRTTDLPLNWEGKRQLKEVSQKIKEAGFKIDKIYTSPLKRARQSTEIIAKTFNLAPENIVIEDDLVDVDIPSLVGQPLSLRDVIHAKGTDEYDKDYAAQGNESRQQIVNRMKGVFDKVALENKGKTVAMVSHGDPLRFLVYSIEYPEEKIPGMNILINSDYPKKGQAIKIVLNSQRKFVRKEFL